MCGSLHRGLGGTNKPGSSIIHKVFQGQVRSLLTPSPNLRRWLQRLVAPPLPARGLQA